MEITLIRHGLPVRIEKADGTPADPPLCDEGRDQAERMATWLANAEIDALYASPMRRAQETAAPLAKRLGLTIELEPGVVEYDSESDYYIPMEELKRTDYERWKRFVTQGYGDGVDMELFHRTVVESIERLIDNNAGRRIAVVCHGGVINAWAAQVLGLTPQLFFDPRYTSINRFMAARSGERSVVSLNESAHLRV
jgi:probable phosphoglycerate mutase